MKKFGASHSADEKVTKCHFRGEGISEAVAPRQWVKAKYEKIWRVVY